MTMESPVGGETIDSLVGAADPLEPGSAVSWAASPAAEAILRRVLAEPLIAARPRVSGALVAVGFAAALALASGTVVAAVHLLGGPAPPQVTRDLSAVDQGMPGDLRYNPDVSHARLVAVAGTSSMYAADLAGGGYCGELVVQGRAAGAICVTALSLAAHPVQVSVPFSEPITPRSPVTVGGRVTLPAATAVVLRYADGGIDRASLTSGYYVIEVTAPHLGSVHAADFSLRVVDAAGSTLEELTVPAVMEEAPPPSNSIDATTISDSSDFTKVLGVDGHVPASATSLVLRFPDGRDLQVRLQPDHSFHLDIPADLQRAFAVRPGLLVARDAAGDIIATQAIESVAAARAAGM